MNMNERVKEISEIISGNIIAKGLANSVDDFDLIAKEVFNALEGKFIVACSNVEVSHQLMTDCVSAEGIENHVKAVAKNDLGNVLLDHDLVFKEISDNEYGVIHKHKVLVLAPRKI